MTQTVRQCQQIELYAAERTVDPGKRFASVEQVQTFVNGLRDTWWWVKWVRDVEYIEVILDRRESHSFTAYTPGDAQGWITLCMSDPYLNHVIHEVAHILAGARHHSQSHDPWFARVYYELTYLIRGSEAAQELAIAFDELGVDYDAEGLS